MHNVLVSVMLPMLILSSLSASETDGRRLAILSEQTTGLDTKLVEHVTGILKAGGWLVTPLNAKQLCDPVVFNAGQFDGLVLTESPLFPAAGEKSLHDFLAAGGDLVLMGGPNSVFHAAFEDYEVYRLKDVTSIQPAPGQPWRFTLTGRFEGLSAVGFQFHNESLFVPLLSAVDRHGRGRGWAGGMHINYAGTYKNSKWALFGITTPAFYRSAEFARVLTDTLARFKGNELESWAASENKKALARVVEAKPPLLPLRINKSKQRFERADGGPFFIIGCNYIGGLHCKYSADNPAEVEADFQRMQRAGINTIRIYSMDRFLTDSGAALLKNCARKYGVYFIPVVVDHPDQGSQTEIQERARKMAKLFKGEPMLLGYDLTNEPYFWEMGKIKADSGKTLWELNPQPPHGWKIYEQAIGLDLKGTDFPGVNGKLPYPTDPGQRQGFDSVNNIYGTFIGWLRDAIREVDADAPITVGYNTVWSCMPANEPLEFLAAHLYEQPENLDGVLRNLTTLDRLRSVWPDRPICAGEFGYSGGDIIGGKLLDVHTIAVGEFTHYLYALAHGYNGMMKWSLTDFSRWTDWRQVTWIPREEHAKHCQQARFGMFYDNGTPEGGAKPLVAALRFLRDYVDAGNLGGKLEVRLAQTPIGAGYLFEGRNALFVGDVAYQSPKLTFNAARPANVLLWWNENTIRLLSTADAMVRLDVNAFAPGIALNRLRLEGRRGQAGFEKNLLVIEALEGETVGIR